VSIPVYSVEGLVSWLETQPPEIQYEYLDSSRCLAAMYLKSRGVADYNVPSDKLREWGFHPIMTHGKATYGAALDRAKRQLAAA